MQVHGDFIQVGNGVLRCSGASSGDFSTCTNLNQGTGGYNDYFNMVNNNTDGIASTFNNSSATVTIPSGAKVVYARLFWSANTGRYVTSQSTGAMASGCAVNDPATLPTSGSQGSVLLTANATTTTINGAATTESATSIATSNALYYSSTADVTSQLAGLAAGSAQTITVSNVWAPTGYGCYGGWGLDVVYDFGAYVPSQSSSTLKEI